MLSSGVKDNNSIPIPALSTAENGINTIPHFSPLLQKPECSYQFTKSGLVKSSKNYFLGKKADF
jgi:hypothetical protein